RYSHAGGQSPVWFNVAVQWVHLLAVGVWIGGLAWLLLAIRGLRSEERRTAVRRFSTIAGVALAVTVGSGILRAVTELGGWRPLFDTSFGVTLLIKAALVAGLVALGATNRYRNIPRIDAPNPGLARVRRTVGWEIVVAANGGALAFSLPARPDVGSSTLDLRKGQGGMWSANGTNLSIQGRWDVVVTVQGSSGAVQVPLKVQTRLPPEKIQVSTQAGQP